MKVNQRVAFFVATTGFIAIGYFGVQYFGRNTMFTLAAAVGGGGAISYILQKPSEQQSPASEPEPTIAPMKTQRKAKKS
jgi:hypothetical protein